MSAQPAQPAPPFAQPAQPAPPFGAAGHMNGSPLLTADQLAERWQVPRSQVYRLTRERGLPTVRLGRYYRYALAAVETFEREGGSDA